MELPKKWRHENLRYRKLNPGVDLPAWFVENIRAIDDNLYFVWHPHRFLYDDIMNQYTGSMEDPRFTIGPDTWGFCPTDGDGAPLPENRWHCWRLCDTGWAHIFDVRSKEPSYLKKICDRLYVQAKLTAKYGPQAYIQYMKEEREKQQEKDLADRDQLFEDVQKENSWLMNKAMENFKSGVTAPTNPTRDSIYSYPGQVKRSKGVVPISDEEGGLILPDELKDG